MATVLLLRHGRTQANADGVLAGWSDVELDPTGTDQASAVAERLRSVALKAAVTSPLKRCRQTVETVAELHRGLAVTVDERIGECRYGDWQGRPLSELASEELWRVVQHYPSGVVFPGADGAPLAVTSAQAVAAIREIDARITAQDGPGAVWLACSHGDVIKAVVADALGMHLDLFQRIVVDPCSVTVIRYTPLRPFLVRLNDTGGDLTGLAAKAQTSDAAVGGDTPEPSLPAVAEPTTDV